MEGELEKKFERFELDLRTLGEAKRKFSADGLFGWISSPRSTPEEDFDPLSIRADDVDQGQESREHDEQMQKQQPEEEHEETINVEDYVDAEYLLEDPEAYGDDLVSESEASMAIPRPPAMSLPKPKTDTEVKIHSILTGMMDTVKFLGESNKKMQSEYQENEARLLDRKLRLRQSRVLSRVSTVDDDVDTAMGECAPSAPKTSTSTAPRFDADFPRVQADSSVTRKAARTDTMHEPVVGPVRSKRKRTLGPFTQVKVSASDCADSDSAETESSTTRTISYKEYRPQKLRPLQQSKRIGRRPSDDAVSRPRRLHKRRPAAPAATSSPDASPRAVVELFLNPLAVDGSGVDGVEGSASDVRMAPTLEPRQRLSWRTEPAPGAKKADEQATAKEQPSPRDASPRVPPARRPMPQPPSSTAAETSPPLIRQRISWRTDAVSGPKAAAATTSLVDAPAPVETPAPRKPRPHRRKTAPVEEKAEEVAELEPADSEPAPDAATTTTSVRRGRGEHTRDRQLRWQRRQDEQAARSVADEVVVRVRAQRQWLRAQEELGGEEAVLTRSYELPTVSSVMKRVVKSYMPAVGLTGIPFVVGTSTSPTHHCGLKMQAEMRKFKLRLTDELGKQGSAMTSCSESECAGCPAAHAGRCAASYSAYVPQRPEDRWSTSCTEPSCTCSMRKTQTAEKVLQKYAASRTNMSISPSRNRFGASRVDVSALGATASVATLPVAASYSQTAAAVQLSKTDLHGESLQTLKVKIGGLKECLVRLQDRFTRLHQMRNDATLDLTEKQITELDKKIENKEQEINVVLGLMREIFTLSRSQKTSVASMAESTRGRQSRGIVGGSGGFALRKK